MIKLPKDGRSQEIGRLAGRALGNKLPISWIEKELDGDSDFGIDYFIQLKSDEGYVSFSFYLQLKGTTVPSYSADKGYISYDFKVETLQYYHQQEPLVMVAVVDLKEKEERLSECPIYYFWLDDDWFEQNNLKLSEQSTISVKIPTSQLLHPSLNVFDYYSARIAEKYAVSKLKQGIKSLNKPIREGIETIASAISEKPILLKSLEEKSDAPWLHNPEGTIPNELKRCSESLMANKLVLAKRILDSLEPQISSFTQNELAEFHYQQGCLFALEGKYIQSEDQHRFAFEADQKDRYRLGYIESKFKFESLPSSSELEGIIETLDNGSYHKCMVKAKCLILLDRKDEALELLETNYPDKILGKMVIYSIAGMTESVDKIIDGYRFRQFDNDKDTYLFNSLSARRRFNQAISQSDSDGKYLPLQGKVAYDLNLMKQAFGFAQKAWSLAKDLGYPNDITMLLDISILIYGYFDVLDDLTQHVDAMLIVRPKNSEIVRPYSRVLFNAREYERAIELIENLEELEPDDCALHILSHYHLGRKSKTLELVGAYESKLVASQNRNIPLVFCIASEIAEELFNLGLAKKYEQFVIGYSEGKALIAIRKFVRSCNSEPSKRSHFAQDLFEVYVELNKPASIAEQLFHYLDVDQLKSALQAIELGEQLLQISELKKNDYLHLAQAFLTANNWEKAQALAEKNIEKGIETSKWKLILAASLKHQGRVGVAYESIKDTLSAPNVTKDSQVFYLNLCLALGLLENVIDVLQELYATSSARDEKIHFLRLLISVYSYFDSYHDELKVAVDRYGEMVDQNDCEEEGRYLLFFLSSPKHEEDEAKIKDFQARLARYTDTFPQSHLLRKGLINLDDGTDSVVKAMRELTGTTEEQIILWEKNKRAIRNGSLRVPFSMRGMFLSDTRDIFTTWAYSLRYPEEFIEYRIQHSPQILKDSFVRELHNTNVILEETSLLALNELDLLDSFLDAAPHFSLLESVFDKIAQSTHQLSGTLHTAIPKQILKTIHRHLHKMTLIDGEGDDPVAVYSNALKQNKVLLLSEDLYLQQYIDAEVGDVKFGNVFNVIEALTDAGLMSEEQKHTMVAKVCELGLLEPNMRMEFLAETAAHFLCAVDAVDYSDTRFKPIFDKLFEVGRDSVLCINLLFRMIYEVNKYRNINNKTLLSMLNAILIRHPVKSLNSLVALWFIMRCVNQKLVSKTLLCRNEEHFNFWKDYCEMIASSNKGIDSLDALLIPIINELFTLDEQLREKAYRGIMSCFVPTTKEADRLNVIYQEYAFTNRLMAMRDTS